MNDTVAGTVYGFIYDTADIAGLAAFYTELGGFKQLRADADWITLVDDNGWRLAFQAAPDHVPPRWPTQAAPQQYHLDFRTPDMAGETERAISLGAKRLDGGGETWTVLADPSGHPFCVCANADSTSLAWYGVTIDCPDGKRLAEFYAAVLGYELTYEGPEGAYLTSEGKLPIMFQNLEETYNAPRWPDPAHPQQGHLDIDVDDIKASEALVLGLGATTLSGASRGKSGFRVYGDPAGHPFCLVWGQ